MSTLYSASVRSIENETTVVVAVDVVHPDSMYISPTPGFALMLLWEATDGEGPLATEIDLDTVLDADWMRTYARGFVSKVETLELENEPPDAAQRDYEHAYWKNPEEWLRGTLEIQVTDPAWISGLTEGTSWDSTAFESNQSFDATDPIRFEESAPRPSDADVDPHAGLIPVPRLFFLDHLAAVEDDYIWFPKHSDKAYVADEIFEDEEVTEELLESLVGEVVWYDSYGPGVGVLMPDNMIVHISKGSYGSTGFHAGSGKIGRARFDTTKKRLANPLTISGMARRADPVVTEAVVDGPKVTLTVRTFDKDREPSLQHSANALALIADSENESFDGFKNATSRLGIFLARQGEERGISFANSLYGHLSEGMIVDYRVEKVRQADPVDFDGLEGDELIDALESEPWNTWKIEVITTDPAWVEHLPKATPYAYGFYWIEEPKPWTGEPLTCSNELGEMASKATDFPLSHESSSRGMDLDMVAQLGATGDPIGDEDWSRLVEEHVNFLETGGAGGHWQTLSVSGLPLCIYQGAEGAEGEQLVLRLKNVAGKSARESMLEFADLSGTYAPEIDLAGSRLSGSVAIDSIFDRANFEGARLRGVDFSGARLRSVNFRGADLTEADFECCDLTGADFTGATLEGSRFPGAILDDAIPPAEAHQ